jgi:hypothetical protein
MEGRYRSDWWACLQGRVGQPNSSEGGSRPVRASLIFGAIFWGRLKLDFIWGLFDPLPPAVLYCGETSYAVASMPTQILGYVCLVMEIPGL